MTIHFSRRALRNAALLTLLAPAAAFLLTWVRPLIALPSCAAILAAYLLYVRSGHQAPARDVFGHEEDGVDCPIALLALVVLCALMWTFFSGIGGLFYQNEDHYGRNAIFHDLLEHASPVYFEGTSYALTYYIAYWLLPALAGKACALLFGADCLWGAANAALFIQTVWFLSLTLLMFLSLIRAKGLLRSTALLLLFVLFSGMDGLMIPFTPNYWNEQLEWWAKTYQYSSNTTCLFWVYNQALPAWLAVMLLFDHPRDVGSYALIGLAAFPFSPMPFIGLMVYFLGMFIVLGAQRIRERGAAAGVIALLGDCLTARNVLACLALAPCFILYFASNAASHGAPFRLDLYLSAYSLPVSLGRLALFLLIEFGAYSLCIGKQFAKNPLFWLTQLLLILAPMFRIGYGQDFSMRASIPGLIAMCLFCGRYLAHPPRRGRIALGAAVLGVLLLIGCITPGLEFLRGAYKVKTAGTIFLTADPFKTVLHPDADTHNFICQDVTQSIFYRYIANGAR